MPDTSFNLLPEFSTLQRMGPALVTGVCGREVEIEAEGRRFFATLAVPGIYAPVAGDTVLAVEGAAASYVIGVLNATGPSIISVPGDLRLLAPNGEIVLQGATVAANAEELRLNAQNLAVTAERATERFGAVRRFVTQIFDLDAGELRTRISGTYALLAKRLRAQAEEDVKIEGQKIHLG
jgi:hypothetical protein